MSKFDFSEFQEWTYADGVDDLIGFIARETVIRITENGSDLIGSRVDKDTMNRVYDRVCNITKSMDLEKCAAFIVSGDLEKTIRSILCDAVKLKPDPIAEAYNSGYGDGFCDGINHERRQTERVTRESWRY